ncbi:hypothetical protein CU097_000706, partial [Rhizopus azygosporus]
MDSSDILNSILSPSLTEATIKTTNRPERQRTLSAGYSINSNANFYDIPTSDAFNDLLERYIPLQNNRPQRNVEDNLKNPELMVMKNMWRSVAKYARQHIIQSDPSDLKSILELWHMRLLALTKLGLYQLATAELEKLGDLNRPELRDPVTKESMVPFALWILWARLPSFLKYPNVTLERLTMLAAKCKRMQQRDPVWERREIQTYLVIASHWIAIQNYSAAVNTMEDVLKKRPDQVDVLSGLGRLYLQMGDVGSATSMFERIEQLIKQDEAVIINKAFTSMAKGEWSQARDLLEQVHQSNKDNLLVMNNLAVCEIYLGNLVKAIEILETLTMKNPTSAGICESI